MAKQTLTGPKRRAGAGFLYVIIIMLLAIGLGIAMSGGGIPVDPNGPHGPPTLPPYFDQSDYGKQSIILPTGALTPDAKGNLQLKTFSVNICGQKTAIDFLIDTSASMEDFGKMDKVKSAMKAFVTDLPGKAVISIDSFSAVVRELVPFGYYKDNKAAVNSAIDNNFKPDGWTRTRDGMKLAQEKITDAIGSNKYPGYHYFLVLITDGVPEIPEESGTSRKCEVKVADPLEGPAGRCFSEAQDPRVPDNLGDQIKALGVSIYTIGLTGPAGSSDAVLEPSLSAMLTNLASDPKDQHYYKTLNAIDVKSIFDQVSTNMCEGMIYNGEDFGYQ